MKKALYISRLITELSVQLDNQCIQIKCDNLQTIQLVTAEIALLWTKLQHIDIHNHWLCQEISSQKVVVDYTLSQDMLTDGFTKALQNNAFSNFIQQLGLVDIQERLDQRCLQKLDIERYQETA